MLPSGATCPTNRVVVISCSGKALGPICNEIIVVMKECNIRQHYESKYATKLKES
jgi:hypothetical protein